MVEFKGCNTDVFFNEAMDWMRQQTKPFFLSLAPTAAHEPFHVDPRYVRSYADLPEALAAFYGMTAELDENVGRLLDFLQENGQARNTILIYMTDNGTVERTAFYSAGMRGRKGSFTRAGTASRFLCAGRSGSPDRPARSTP